MEEVVSDIGINEQEMMREALRLVASQYRQPGELTVEMAAAISGLETREAYNTLEKMVKRNLVTCRKVLEDGHLANAYAPAKGSWKEVLESLRK